MTSILINLAACFGGLGIALLIARMLISENVEVEKPKWHTTVNPFPKLTETAGYIQELLDQGEEDRASMIAKRVVEKIQAGGDVIDALASDDHAFVSGITIHITGRQPIYHDISQFHCYPDSLRKGRYEARETK